MTSTNSGRSIGVWIVSVVAVVFGVLTVKSGGSVLFVDGLAREDAGNYVPLVLWFNFLAGFAYLIAGVGLFLEKRWVRQVQSRPPVCLGQWIKVMVWSTPWVTMVIVAR